LEAQARQQAKAEKAEEKEEGENSSSSVGESRVCPKVSWN